MEVLEKIKKQKVIAMILLITLIFNLFSPYTALGYWQDENGQDKYNLLSVSKIEKASSGNYMFSVEFAAIGDVYAGSFDVSLSYDADLFAPANKSTGAAVTTKKIAQAMELNSDSFTFQKSDFTSSSIRMTGTSKFDAWWIPDGDGEADSTYGARFSIFKVYFYLKDASKWKLDGSDEITQDMISWKTENSLRTGYKQRIADDEDGTNPVYIDDLKYVAYEGFLQENNEPEIVKIEIIPNPTKMNYVEGDTLNFAGGKVKLTYDDDETNPTVETISIDDAISSGKITASSSEADSSKIVTFSGGSSATATLKYYVLDSISLKNNISKTNYEHNDTINFAGGVIEAKYVNVDGSFATEDIDIPTGISNGEITVDRTKADVHNTTVTASYHNKQTTIPLTVTDPIDSIVITTMPTNVEYTHEDAINPAGGVIKAVKRSGDEITGISMTSSDVSISPTAADINVCSPKWQKGEMQAGTQNITVTYTGNGVTKTTTYPITVNDSVTSIAVKTHPTAKNKYGTVAGSLNYTGATITATTASGNSFDIPVTAGMVNTSAYNANTLSAQNLPITYAGKTTTAGNGINITLRDYINGITVTAPNNLSANYNGSLDLTNVTYVKNYASGATSTAIPVTNNMISGFVSKPTSNKFDSNHNYVETITVKLTTADDSDIDVVPQTDTFNVTVKDTLSGIKIINNPTKTTYDYNESFSTLGGKIQEMYASGATGSILSMGASNVSVTELDGTSSVSTAPNANTFTNGVSKKNVLVKYKDYSAQFEIKILDTVSSISIDTAPKDKFNHGDTFSTGNGKLKVQYSSGASATVSMSDNNVIITKADGSAINMSPAANDYNSQYKYTENLLVEYYDEQVNYPITIINDIKKIEMHTTPKTSYNLNESLDITTDGTTYGDILVTRATGTPSVVSMQNTTQSALDSSTVGQKTITVTYTENDIPKTTTYNVTVADNVTGITIKGTPKTAYKYNEELVLPKIEVTKGSGKQEVQVTQAMVDGYDKTVLGNQTVTITYEGKTATYTVNVKDYVTGVKVQPASITGNYNDELGTLLTNKNVKYVVTYAKAGDKPAVALPESMITSTYSKTSLTAQTLNVKYTDNDTNSFTKGTDFPATLTVTLGDTLSSITVTAPTNTQTYNHGNGINLTGATITLNYASGATSSVTPTASMVFEQGTTNAVNMSPTTYGTDNKVTKTVTLKYEQGGKTGSIDFPITIINDIKKIEMHTTPKTSYNVNEALDITTDGTNYGEIKVTRATGTPSIVSMQKTTQSTLDSSTEGTKTITVSYTENGITKTTTYNVTVTDTVTGIAIKGTPKTAYKYNEDLTLPTIEVTRGSGKTDVQVTSSMVSGYDKTVLGNQTVTITYEGKTATYTVNVKDYVKEIRVTPSTVTGDYGSTLASLISGKNIKYIVTYAKAGDKTGVTLPESMIKTVYNPSSTTPQALSVEYTDNDTNSFTNGTKFPATLTVTLGDTISSITVTAPTSTQTYNHGNAINLTGATITINYSSGATSSVTPSSSMVFEQGTANVVNMSPTTYGTDNKVTKTVTLKYEQDGKTGSIDFPITIINDIRKIEMQTKPKTSYNVNEALDITTDGTNYGEIKVTRAAGTPSVVSMQKTTQSTLDSSTEGTKTITVSYTENGITKTTTYNVTVTDTVTGIAIKGTPKTAYKYNDELTLPTIEVTKGSGKTDVQVTSSMVSGYDKTVLGNQTVTITYGGKTTSYTVNVKDYVTGIKIQPASITGTYNDELSTLLTNKNVKYVVTYAKAGDKTGVALPESMITSTYDKTLLTAQSLNVKYTDNDINSFTNGTDFTASLMVTIDDPIQKLTLLGTPKTDYEYDDDLDVSNLSIKVERLSGTTTIPVTDDNVSGYNKTTIGTQTVQISYDNQPVETFVVEVTDPVVDMKIETKPKTNYRVNEQLDVTNGTLKLTKKSGDTEIVDITTDMVSGFDSSDEVVDQELTVTYEEFTDKYKITVAEPVMSISMNTIPKTDYKYGDNLDVTDGTINVVKSIGTKVIDLAESMVTELDGSEFDSTNMSTRDLLVTYGGQTTTYEITVRDYTVGAVLTAPSKTTYEYGEELDLSDAEIKIVTASGKEKTIPVEGNSNVTVSGYEPTKVGTQTVTLTYTDEGNVYTKTFPVMLEDNIASISIINTPETNYKYGDSLDVTGGMIRVTRTSGEYEDIPITESMVDGYDPEKLGNQTLTVYHEGFKDTYVVTVKDYVKDIKVEKPNKLIYKLDEDADLDGGAVVEIMASGNTGDEIPLDMSMIRDFDTSKEGAHSVIVIHVDDEGKIHAKTFGITIVDPIASVRLNSLPDKLDYLYGESLDITGATIIVTKESEEGKNEAGTILPVTSDMVSGYNSHKLGEQTITVTYKDEKTEEEHKMQFIVNVEDYISHITVSEPDKTEYEYGDNLDLDGGTVKVITASGKVEEEVPLTASMLTNNFDNTSIGTQTINVNYKGFDDSFDVTLNDSIKGISINTVPDKTEYEYGEDLDTTGATITVVKSSGITIIPVTKDMIDGYNPNKVGTQIITVNYDGEKTEFVVKVKEKVKEDKPEDNNNNGDDDEEEKPVVKPNNKPSYKPNKPSNPPSEEITPPVEEKPVENENNDKPVVQKPVIDNTKKPVTDNSTKPTDNINDKKTETLGVKDEKDADDNTFNKKALACLMIAMCILILLILTRRNVKVYVEENKEFVLGGKDKISKKDPELDIDKYLDGETYNNRVKIVLNDNISEELDGKEIEIKFRGKIIKHKVKYEDKPYEFILE